MEKEKDVKQQNSMKGYNATDRDFQKTGKEGEDNNEKPAAPGNKNLDTSKNNDTVGVP